MLAATILLLAFQAGEALGATSRQVTDRVSIDANWEATPLLIGLGEVAGDDARLQPRVARRHAADVLRSSRSHRGRVGTPGPTSSSQRVGFGRHAAILGDR